MTGIIHCIAPPRNQMSLLIQGGLVFCYYPIDVSGTNEAERSATVLAVYPDRDIPFWLSNNKCVEPMNQVRWIKVMSCGVLQNHPKTIFRHICEFKLVKVGHFS
jgi:hypothetical protein